MLKLLLKILQVKYPHFNIEYRDNFINIYRDSLWIIRVYERYVLCIERGDNTLSMYDDDIKSFDVSINDPEHLNELHIIITRAANRMYQLHLEEKHQELELTDTSAVDKRKRWKQNARNHGKCSLCPPHGGENFRRRYGKRGKTKPRYKDKN